MSIDIPEGMMTPFTTMPTEDFIRLIEELLDEDNTVPKVEVDGFELPKFVVPTFEDDVLDGPYSVDTDIETEITDSCDVTIDDTECDNWGEEEFGCDPGQWSNENSHDYYADPSSCDPYGC
jgi:hypothetical protein